MVWILDLDGVVWLADDVIPGVPEAVERLRAAGNGVLFLTNNSSIEVGYLVTKFAGMGMRVEPEEIVTSAQAAASMLEPGSTALVCAGDGVREALVDRGVTAVDTGPADAVVVGFHKDFDYGRLHAAYQAAAGVEPEVAGKPFQPMADTVRRRIGDAADDGLLVGDRPDTDGLMARRLGLPFALVFTGVTSPDDAPFDPDPAMTAPDLATLVDQELSGP